MPEGPLSAHDLRLAGLGLLLTAALVVVGAWFFIVRPPAPSLPRGSGRLVLEPATAHAGDVLQLHTDQPLAPGRTRSLLVSRWDGRDWADTRLLADGKWSQRVGGRFSVTVSLSGEPVTDWSSSLPVGTPAGHYLVCDLRTECALLDVV